MGLDAAASSPQVRSYTTETEGTCGGKITQRRGFKFKGLLFAQKT